MNNSERARCSLAGLSVGDAFGERFFVNPELVASLIAERAIPSGNRGPNDVENDIEARGPLWYYTDDTLMAISIVTCLEGKGEIDQDWLVQDFARRYNPYRGYGAAMHRYLTLMGQGADWRVEAPQLFAGQGSYGNGAAMRVAPLGGYFADDLESVARQARLSAEVTHAHPEAIAGAIAVAVAAAYAWRLRDQGPPPREREFIDLVLPHVPDSIVREKIRHARNLGPNASVRLAVAALGNGSNISAQDTVPYTLWCASRHLDDYRAALWLTLTGLGDIDTTCAIVGGIVSLYTGVEGIPAEWLQAREPLPA
jgi:ADP-ribosylglycohydrolase